jgi:hypothetical protein
MDPVAGLLVIHFLPSVYPTSLLLRPFERLTCHCRSQEGTKSGRGTADLTAADLIIACQNNTRPASECVFVTPLNH